MRWCSRPRRTFDFSVWEFWSGVGFGFSTGDREGPEGQQGSRSYLLDLMARVEKCVTTLACGSVDVGAMLAATGGASENLPSGIPSSGVGDR